MVNIMDQYRPENETDPNSPRFNPEFRELLGGRVGRS